MTIQWAPHLIDRLIGPKFSKLKAVPIPEVQEVPNYHGSLFLNHVFDGIYDEHFVRYLVRFIRKLVPAVRDYRSAREHLLTCFSSTAHSNDQISAYLRAISHLEACIQGLQPGLLCLWKAGEVRGYTMPVFTDDYDRLRRLCNRCKHFDEDFEHAERTNEKDAPISAIWIEDDKIVSTKGVALSFQELADILLAAIQDAKDFSETIALELRQRRASRS